ncbi:hypothetical protein OHA37_20550 [Streptomyces sp. NBC_00335]|uniref:hypothetical protein n=1 Tax=unclassified Streptomyces TaxID=2593676 RepID=UPI00225AD934|nr:MULTISPECIES: hypothetical protein [unclassified Streptomyces]MCX5406252.1 hypothetical protein [Streptomyces sp. NBC_00086]
MEHEQTIPDQRKEAESAPEPGTPDAASAAPEAAPEAPEAAPEATLETAPGTAPDAVLETAPATPRVRRGRRAVLLIAGAAVLGVLAGTITGYAIQYDREPTPLAPLAQADLAYPKALAPDDATTHQTINANRWHKTDDDLAKLLVEVPGGAKGQGTGYVPPEYFATFFKRPDVMVGSLSELDVRRIASVGWEVNDTVFVDVRLIQFKDHQGAEEYQTSQSEYMPEAEHAGNEGVAIPGLPAELGHVWVDSKADEKPGYLPLRNARALARRGDIVLDIHYTNNRGKITQGDVVNLAKRQLERL